MSATPADLDPSASVEGALESLTLLRAELDRLDDALHDTLMRRAEVVERVAALKDGVALRPGREAAIIRRLLARHSGALPRQTIVRVWRELLAGTTAMQGGLLIAVCDNDPACGYSMLAREHFGALTPLHVHGSPAQAIAEIGAGIATAAVLPMPTEGGSASTAWWTGLLYRDRPRVYVVGLLPFWAARPKGAPRVQALVVAAVPPDPSDADRSLLGLEIPLDLSRARFGSALSEVGFTAMQMLIRREPGSPAMQAMVDVAGHVSEADPRLAAIRNVLRPPVVLGAYAVPLSEPAA